MTGDLIVAALYLFAGYTIVRADGSVDHLVAIFFIMIFWPALSLWWTVGEVHDWFVVRGIKRRAHRLLDGEDTDQ